MEMSEYFDSVAPAWDSKTKKTEDISRVIKLANITSGQKILDIGCGTGIIDGACVDAGAKYVLGIDVSSRMIEQAKDKYFSNNKIEYKHTSIYDLCEEPFDVAIMFNVYPHLLDIEKLVVKVHSHLNENGRFLVAHGKGRKKINEHHANIPDNLAFLLPKAEVAAENWKGFFNIDTIIDEDTFYCFGGTKALITCL